MTDSNRRNFDDHVQDAEQQSDKALYSHLKVHIFGPFEGDCFAYLHDLKFRLHEFGFTNAKVCDDRGNQPPDHYTEQQTKEFWWKESEQFLQDADVAIFVFLDHIFARPSLSQRARGKSHSPSSNPKEVNSSVAFELMYWLLHEDPQHNKAYIFFEDGIYDDMGSLIPGLSRLRDLRWEKLPDQDIDEAVELARQRCMNWTMNELHGTLQKRHLR